MILYFFVEELSPFKQQISTVSEFDIFAISLALVQLFSCLNRHRNKCPCNDDVIFFCCAAAVVCEEIKRLLSTGRMLHHSESYVSNEILNL